jgi:hypothetical protein
MKRSPATPAAPRFRTSDDDRPPRRLRHSSLLPTLASIAALAGLLGCAAHTVGPPASEADTPTTTADALADDVLADEPPIVRIWQYRASPDVTVVAWNPTASAYGLRGMLRRSDGTLTGGYRRGDHVLYVQLDHFRHAGYEGPAMVTEGVPLVRWVAREDTRACLDGPPCSPMSFVAFSIPDATLRENRDSLVVWFTGGYQRTLTVGPDLLDAYLSTVDSLTVALRR